MCRVTILPGLTLSHKEGLELSRHNNNELTFLIFSRREKLRFKIRHVYHALGTLYIMNEFTIS